MDLFKELDSAIDEQIDKKIKTASSSVEESEKVTSMELKSFLENKNEPEKVAAVDEEGFEKLSFDSLSKIFNLEKKSTEFSKIASNALELLNSELQTFTKEATVNVTETVKESTLAKVALALKLASEEIEEMKTGIKLASRVKKLITNGIFGDEEQAEEYVKSACERLSGDDFAVDNHLDNLIIAKDTDFSSDVSKLASKHVDATQQFVDFLLGDAE